MTNNPDKQKYRVLVTGSRDWQDHWPIVCAFRDYILEVGVTNTFVLVHGACPTGADYLAEKVVNNIFFDWEIERHPADWTHMAGQPDPSVTSRW